MRPTLRSSSMEWTCFTAVGSTAFVWCRQTVILPGWRHASANRGRRVWALGSKDAGEFPSGVSSLCVYGEPALQARRNEREMRCRLRSRFSHPAQPFRPSESLPRWKATMAGSPWEMLEGGLPTWPLISIREIFGFRKLSDLVRKTDAFEIEHPEGGTMRIRTKSATERRSKVARRTAERVKRTS